MMIDEASFNFLPVKNLTISPPINHAMTLLPNESLKNHRKTAH